MYKLYNTGARAEHYCTLAAIYLGDESSPSAENLNVLLVKNDSISLTRLAENCSSDNLYSRPGCHVLSKAFSSPRIWYSSRRHIVIETESDVIR
jgi:hypothetical protein